MSIFTKATNDLFRLRELYIESGNQNLRLSNEMARNYQTAIVTVVLAELAFLGALGIQGDFSKLTATSVSILITAIIFFLVGVGIQQMAVQKEAKINFELASRVDDFIKANKTGSIEHLPKELHRKQYSYWATSKLGNYFLLFSYLLIIAASLLVLVIIWGLALG